MEITALGMIETIGLVSAIEAADAGLKAAEVSLLGTDYVRGGLVMVRFEGEVAAVRSAVDAGTMAAQRVGHVFSSHVIPRAMPEVFCMLASDVGIGPGKRYSGGCISCGGCEGGRREIRALLKKRQELREKEKAEAGRLAAEAETEHGSTEVTAEAPADQAPVKAGSTEAPKAEAAPESSETLETLSTWKVVDLRRYARKLEGFPLTPNDIRYANKSTLLSALETYLKK